MAKKGGPLPKMAASGSRTKKTEREGIEANTRSLKSLLESPVERGGEGPMERALTRGQSEPPLALQGSEIRTRTGLRSRSGKDTPTFALDIYGGGKTLETFSPRAALRGRGGGEGERDAAVGRGGGRGTERGAGGRGGEGRGVGGAEGRGGEGRRGGGRGESQAGGEQGEEGKGGRRGTEREAGVGRGLGRGEEREAGGERGGERGGEGRGGRGVERGEREAGRERGGGRGGERETGGERGGGRGGERGGEGRGGRGVERGEREAGGERGGRRGGDREAGGERGGEGRGVRGRGGERGEGRGEREWVFARHAVAAEAMEIEALEGSSDEDVAFHQELRRPRWWEALWTFLGSAWLCVCSPRRQQDYLLVVLIVFMALQMMLAVAVALAWVTQPEEHVFNYTITAVFLICVFFMTVLAWLLI